MPRLSIAFFAALPLLATSFSSNVLSTRTHIHTSKLHLFQGKKSEPPAAQFAQTESGSGNILESTFTGGAFEDEPSDEILASAIKIASQIKSVKDLGWTKAPKRKGKARPRHRAWGGEGEMPVQSKPNYDEAMDNVVEKWLTIEDFLKSTRAKPGPAADSVFVALSGGAKYAERDICEAKIEQWTSGSSAGVKSGRKGAASFNEAAFIKTVNDGRRDLGLGWGAFVSVNTFFASCIVFPNNPAAKALESLVDNLKDQGIGTM